MEVVQYPINLAAKKSGLSAHVIRIWEKRYDAVSPNRTGSNRRLYSEAEINRLRLLGAAVHVGHRIGAIAKLSDDQLRELVTEPEDSPIHRTPIHTGKAPVNAVETAMEAIRGYDEAALVSILERSQLAFGGHGLLASVVVPLAENIGDLWQEGLLTAAHEHFATAVLRTFLLSRYRPFAGNGNSPRLVTVTPSGQHHEMGAVIVAAAANDVGWNALYLGAGLPAAEIANAAVQHEASLVALSIVYPPDDPLLPTELAALRRHLPEATGILVGGRASAAYAGVIKAAGGQWIADLSQLYRELERRRVPRLAKAP